MTDGGARIALSDRRTGLSVVTRAPAAQDPPQSWGVLPIDVGEVLP